MSYVYERGLFYKMVHKINNGNIYISVESLGAELRSLCDVHGTEYLWQGDKDIWSGQSPTIFPMVGRQKDNIHIYEGKSYEMENHGFASICNFRVQEKLSDKLVLRLEDNSKTLKMYPFKFCFDVSFELSGNSMYVRFKVTNTGDKPMPYAVGGHPGFRVPIEDDEQFEDYYLKFDCVENCDAPHLVRDAMAEAKDYIPVLNNTQYLSLNHDMFNKGVLILENLKSRGVELLSHNSGRGVRVDFEGFDNLALWQVKKGNFLCIEPWTSPGTFTDESMSLEKRKGIILLNPGETDEHGYKVTFI